MNLILWWLLIFFILFIFRNKIKNTIYAYWLFLIFFYIKLFFYTDFYWKDANEIWIYWFNIVLLVLYWILFIFIFFIFDLYSNKKLLPKNEEYLKINKYLVLLIILILLYFIVDIFF